MRVESDDWVSTVANSILAAVVRETAITGSSGPFSLDDFLRAWLEHEPSTVGMLPDPPGSPGSSINVRRTYWFYEGCEALEAGGWIAEVGDGKFAVASLALLRTQMLHADSTRPD